MVREVKLLDYLPKFIQDYREIKNIMNAQTPEVQALEDETEKLKNNQFILTCDNVGITRYEKLLGITPNNDDNLSARISRVITRWNDSIPYTYNGLTQKLDILCGVGNYTIIPNFNSYELELIVSLPLSGQIEELERLLSYMIPANIVVKCSNVLDYKPCGTVYTGTATVEVNHYTIN